jgi:hypothetical protein
VSSGGLIQRYREEQGFPLVGQYTAGDVFNSPPVYYSWVQDTRHDLLGPVAYHFLLGSTMNFIVLLTYIGAWLVYLLFWRHFQT